LKSSIGDSNTEVATFPSFTSNALLVVDIESPGKQ
jgi:hypothetical protein